MEKKIFLILIVFFIGRNGFSQKIININEDEFIVDTHIVYVPVPGDQSYPSVAFDGTNYFAVWEDKRNENSDIYGARINSDGILIDSSNILISATPNSQTRPCVAFDGTNYFVVWIEAITGSLDQQIHGLRVNPQGVVLDSMSILISQGICNSPSITFGNTNYLVVWHTGNPSPHVYPDIYGIRISPEGIVIPPAIPISMASYSQENPKVAFDSFNYFVVWQDIRSGSSYDIYGARVRPDGTVIDPSGIPISIAPNHQLSPSIAFDGVNYFVVWTDNRNGNRDIYGARVRPNGTVLDTIGIPISTAENDQISPSVVFDGIYYLVIWQDYRNGSHYDIYCTRVTPEGVVLDTTGIPVSLIIKDQTKPSLIFGNTNYFILWQDYRSGNNWDIYATRMTREGTVLDSIGILIPHGINWQYKPSLAFDGSNYLLVWEDYRSNNHAPHIYGIRVTPSGKILDNISFPITTPLLSSPQFSCAVTFGNSNYFVVWEDYRRGIYADIFGARVTPQGVVLDTIGIPISLAIYHQKLPSIVFGDTNYFVVWEDRRSEVDIYGTRVSSEGIVLDPYGIPISTAANYQTRPSIAFDGSNYFVVWQDNRSGSYDIYGARVTRSGTVLDPSGIPISTAPGDQSSPRIAFDGTNYLVVWQDTRNGNADIYGARVSTSGVVINSFGIGVAPSNQQFPFVAFSGANYIVVWEDYRNGVYRDIYGAKVTPSGVIIGPFPISTQFKEQITPAMARGPENQILIAYSSWTSFINNHNDRLVNTMRIWGKLYPYLKIEENYKPEMGDRNSETQIYPNLFKDKIIIYYKEKNIFSSPIDIKIYDATGKVTRIIKLLPNESKILNTKGFKNNIYFIYLDKNKITKSYKVIKLE